MQRRDVASRPLPASRALGLLFSLLVMLTAQDSAAQPTLLLRAKTVDPVERKIRPVSLLLLEGGVAAVGSYEGDGLREEHPDATVIDLDGSHLLPGLVDLRVHAGAQRSPGHVDDLGAEGTARLLLGAGVTHYVDVHLDEQADRWRRRQRETTIASALSHRGSPIFTAPGGFGEDFPAAHAVASMAEAESVLQRFAPLRGTRRSDLITVIHDGRRPHQRLEDAVLSGLLAAARQRDLPCVVAVGTWDDAEAALAAGATWLCHLPEGEVPAQVLETVSARSPHWIPTVAVGLDFADLMDDESLLADPLLRRVAPDELLEDYPRVRIPQTRYADLRRRRHQVHANLAELDAAGARWLAGSDAGSVSTFFGWSLHRELAHWEEAGLDRWEILAAATVEPARALGVDLGFEVGARADYLVLPRDPSADLSALAEAGHVVLAGRWVDPAAVAAHVPREIREVKPPSPLPFGGRGALFALAALFFAVLLGLRTAIKRAVRSS